jgi:hypothetical protein
MNRLSRRHLTVGAGAGLLLAPFLSLINERPTRAAGTKQAKRLLLFCSMGTKPEIWTPTKVSGESIVTFSASTAALGGADVKDGLLLVEGMPSGNPSDNHGAPDALTGMGNGYYAVNNVQQQLISVDQFVADQLVKAGVNRPIASLLLGSETGTGGKTQFYRASKNLLPIASPNSAFNTVFGNVTASTGTTPDAALKRRKSILDLVSGEINSVRARVGTAEQAKLDSHLDSIRALENKLAQSSMTGGASCKVPTKPSDSTSKSPAIPNDLLHMDILVNALACDITRVAAIHFGTDQALQIDLPSLQGEQHNGFIHSGAPDFKNLIAFEAWLAQQFAALITTLKSKPDPNDASLTLYDTTLVVWARDMGDAVDHNMKSMRFVLGGGAGGYLKTAAGGRYLNLASASGNRHERILLNVCEAMGITSYAGFGDPGMSPKTPMPGIAAS